MARVLFGVFVALLLGGLMLIWYQRAKQDDAVAGARTAISTSTPAVGENDIRVDGWIDDSRVAKETPIAFYISVQNASKDKPIRDIAILRFQKPNFSVPAKESDCWKDDVLTCANAEKPATKLPSGELKPLTAMTIEGHLVAGKDAGSYALSAVVSWKDATGGDRRTPISLGPVTVEDESRKSFATKIKAAHSFFKDLGLALVLFWLGYRVKKIEEEREEKRKRVEERTTRVRQTWTQMLPKIHENAEKYYMRLASDASQAANYYEGPEKDPNICFFFYLHFLGRAKVMTDNIGGYYLKAREGEDCVSEIWDVLRSSADARFTRAKREFAQQQVVKVGTYHEFVMDVLPELQLLKLDFMHDVSTGAFALDAALLEMYALVLGFEMNCSYAFWYGNAEQFPQKSFDETLAKLKRLGISAKYPKLANELARYEKNVPARMAEMGRDLQGIA